jgi:hypothetical protein
MFSSTYSALNNWRERHNSGVTAIRSVMPFFLRHCGWGEPSGNHPTVKATLQDVSALEASPSIPQKLAPGPR